MPKHAPTARTFSGIDGDERPRNQKVGTLVVPRTLLRAREDNDSAPPTRSLWQRLVVACVAAPTFQSGTARPVVPLSRLKDMRNLFLKAPGQRDTFLEETHRKRQREYNHEARLQHMEVKRKEVPNGRAVPSQRDSVGYISPHRMSLVGSPIDKCLPSVVPLSTETLQEERRSSLSLTNVHSISTSSHNQVVDQGIHSITPTRRRSEAQGLLNVGPSWDTRYQEYEHAQRRLGRKLLRRIRLRQETDEKKRREALSRFRNVDSPDPETRSPGGDSPTANGCRPLSSSTDTLETDDSDLDPTDAHLLALDEQGLLEDASSSLSPEKGGRGGGEDDDLQRLVQRHQDFKLDHDPESTIEGISINYWGRRFPVVPPEQLGKSPKESALVEGTRVVEEALLKLDKHNETLRRQAKKDRRLRDANARYRHLLAMGRSEEGAAVHKDARASLRSAETRRTTVALKHHTKELVRQHRHLVGGDAVGEEVGMALLLEEAQAAVHAEQKRKGVDASSTEELRKQFTFMWKERQHKRDEWWGGGTPPPSDDSSEPMAGEHDGDIDELDEDGFVEAFGSFLTSQSYTPPESLLRQWFRDIDVDANGGVSWEEFTSFIVGQSSTSGAVAGSGFVDKEDAEKKKRDRVRRNNKRFGKQSMDIAMAGVTAKEGLPDFTGKDRLRLDAQGGQHTVVVTHDAHDQLARAKEFILMSNPTARHFLNNNEHKNLSSRIAVATVTSQNQDEDSKAAFPFAVSCGKDGYVQIYNPSTCECVQTVNNSAHSASKYLTSNAMAKSAEHLEDFGTKRKQRGSSQSISAVPCTDVVFNGRGTHFYVSAEDRSINCYEFTKTDRKWNDEVKETSSPGSKDITLPGGFHVALRRKYIGVSVASGAAQRHPALFNRQLQTGRSAPETKSTDPHNVFSRMSVLPEGSNVDTTALLGMQECPTSFDIATAGGYHHPRGKFAGINSASPSVADFMQERSAADEELKGGPTHGSRELFYFGFPSGKVIAYPTFRHTRTQEIAPSASSQIHGDAKSNQGPSNTLGAGCASITKIRFVSSLNSILTSSWDTTARLSDAETLQVVTTYGHTRHAASSTLPSITSAKVVESWGHTKAITDFAYSSFHRLLATGGNDRRVLLWSLSSGFNVPVAELSGHNAPLVALTVDVGDSLLFSLDAENTIKVWDLRATQNGPLQSFNALTGGSSGEDTGCGDNSFASVSMGPKSHGKASFSDPKSLSDMCSAVSYHPHSHRLVGVGIRPVFYTSARALSSVVEKESASGGAEVGKLPFEGEPPQDLLLFTEAVDKCVTHTGEVKAPQHHPTKSLWLMSITRDEKERREKAQKVQQEAALAAQALQRRRQWLRPGSVMVDVTSSHLAHTGPILASVYAAPTGALITTDSNVTAVWKADCGRRSLLWDNSGSGNAQLCGGIGLDLQQRRMALVGASGAVTIFNYRNGQLLMSMNPSVAASFHTTPTLPPLVRAPPNTTPPQPPASFTAAEPLTVALLSNTERTIRVVVVVYPRGLVLADELLAKEDPTSEAAKELLTTIPFPGTDPTARFTCSATVPAAGSLTCSSLILGTSDGQLLNFQPTVRDFTARMRHPEPQPTNTTHRKKGKGLPELEDDSVTGFFQGRKKGSVGRLVEDVCHLASKDLVLSVVGTSILYFWDTTESSLRYACDIRILLSGCPHRQLFNPTTTSAANIRDSTVALVCVSAIDKTQLLEEGLWEHVVTEKAAAQRWEQHDQRPDGALPPVPTGSGRFIVADALKFMSPSLFGGGDDGGSLFTGAAASSPRLPTPPHMATLPRRSRVPLTTLVVAAEGGLLYTVDVSRLPQCECPLQYFFRRSGSSKARCSLQVASISLSSQATVSQFEPTLAQLSHVFSATGRCYHAADGLEGACPPLLAAFELAASYPQSSVTSISMSARHRCLFVGTTTTAYNYYTNLHTVTSGMRAVSTPITPCTTNSTFLTSDGTEKTSVSRGTQALLRRFPMLASAEGPALEEESGKGCVRVLSWQGEWMGVVGQEQRWTTKFRFSFADPFAPPTEWLPLPNIPLIESCDTDSSHLPSRAPSDASPVDTSLGGGRRMSSTVYTPILSTFTPQDAPLLSEFEHHSPDLEEHRAPMKGKCILTANSHRLRSLSRARHRKALLKANAGVASPSLQSHLATSGYASIRKHVGLATSTASPLLSYEAKAGSVSMGGHEDGVDLEKGESEISMIIAEGPSIPLGVRSAKVRLKKEGATNGTTTLGLHRRHQQMIANGCDEPSSSSSSDLSPGDLKQRLKVHARLKLRMETSRKDGALGKARRDWSERPSHNLVLHNVSTTKPKPNKGAPM